MCANVMALMMTVIDDSLMTVDIYASLREFLANEAGAETTAPAVSLTDREMVTLRYLRGTQTVEEISRVLCVSVNTTRTHIKSIYRKLEVTCRRDAVRRSHSLP